MHDTQPEPADTGVEGQVPEGAAAAAPPPEQQAETPPPAEQSAFDARFEAIEKSLQQLVEAQAAFAHRADLAAPPLGEASQSAAFRPPEPETGPTNPFLGALRNEFGDTVPVHVLEEAADAAEAAYRWQDFLRQNPAPTVEQQAAAEKAQRRATRLRTGAEWYQQQAAANEQRDAALNPEWSAAKAKSYADEAVKEFRQRTGPANKYSEMPEDLFVRTLARVPVGDSPEAWQQSAVALLDIVLDMHRGAKAPGAPATSQSAPPTNPAPAPSAPPSTTAGAPYPNNKIPEWDELQRRFAAAVGPN